MKHLIVLISVISLSSVGLAKVDPTQKIEEKTAAPMGESAAKGIGISIKGMVCSFCAQGIEKKFKAMPEVASVKVSLETKKVDLGLKEGKNLSDEQIDKVIKDSGYETVKIERVK